MDAATAAIYDKQAVRWQATRAQTTDDLGRRFRAQVGDGLVADLGCGPGRYLGQLGEPVVALDVSASMLALARKSGYPLARADLEALPVRTGTLAGAFARHSYLHVPKARMPGALADLRRVLEPRGLLMLSVIEGDHEGYNLPNDDFPGRYFAFWRAGELAAALSEAGFVNVAVEYSSRPQGTKAEGDLLATAQR